MKAALRILLGIAVVWMIFFFRQDGLLRYYPVVVVAVVLAVFIRSLFRTPVAEVVARRMGETLDARGVEYCRRATVAWTVFLAVHLAVTLATVFLSREIWVFYNGFLAYILLGLMFAGEWLVRRRVKHG